MSCSDLPPPGRVVRFFDDHPEQMARIFVAVSGLHERLSLKRDQVVAGGPAYHALTRELGDLFVILCQCWRALPPDLVQRMGLTFDALEKGRAPR